MEQHALSVLEFPAVLEAVAGHAQGALGAGLVRSLRPGSDPAVIQARRGLYGDMAAALRLSGAMPGFFAEDLSEVLVKCAPQSSALAPEELLLCGGQLAAVREVREFLRDERYGALAALQALAGRLAGCDDLREDLRRSIDVDGSVLDSAGPGLRRIRAGIAAEERRIQRRLDDLVRSPALEDALQDRFVTRRNGRYVVPVKRDARNAVPGLVHDQSGSGQTLFIEPGETLAMGNHLATLRLQERDEIRRILAALTARVRARAADLRANQEVLAELDAAAAVARWGAENRCLPPTFGDRLELRGARHPLLLRRFAEEGAGRQVVPLDLALPESCRVLAVTGSNTGGKTIVLKTVGLLALLAQSGLPVPVDEGSVFPVYDHVLADIGDEQSIQASLSTFSAHVRNIAGLLRQSAAGRSLVLLDELGAGTDPLEGGAIACGILQELARRPALTIATTHLGMVKNFVHSRRDMLNAAVRFDLESLRPEYRLDIGRPGASHALLIARRTGMPEEVLRAAERMMTTDHLRLEEMLSRLEADQRRLSSRAQQAEQARNEVVRDRDRLRRELSDLDRERQRLLHAASSEAEALVQDSRKDLENLLRRLREEGRGSGGTGLNQEAARIRRELEERERDLAERRRRSAPRPAEPLPKAQLRAGGRVWIERLGAHGVIEEVQPGRRQVRVRVNGLPFLLGTSELERGRGQDAPPEPPPVRIRTPRVAGDTSHEINVIGLRVEEAVPRVESFLNEALLAGLGELRIVHGFGTGRLRQGVHAWLRRQPYVREFHLGQEGQDPGAGGVTVVRLE